MITIAHYKFWQRNGVIIPERCNERCFCHHGPLSDPYAAVGSYPDSDILSGLVGRAGQIYEHLYD